MLRYGSALTRNPLERELLRATVGRLEAGRHPCADCGRSPLEGEEIHLYGSGRTVCALCRPRHRAQPETTETVRHAERGQTVRPRARLAL